MSLLTELKRRNVFRVAAAYIIVGWLLTEVLSTLLPMFGAPDWVGKAVVVVAAVTFVPVIIFAWAFELTPDGIKREKDVDRSHSITSDTGRKLDYVTIAAVIAGVLFIGWSKSGDEESAPTIEVAATSGAPSVAVLPFVNMSGNADNEYFSDGLTETLLHMLAQIPDIKVAARTSSFAFKGQEQDIRKIALALGVAHILEGSVQRSGNKVRVTAQLIRADDGFHVWSSNYDRTLNDIFAIQDEIAADVGQSLTASLLGGDEVRIESVGTHDVVAYDLYLQALSHRAIGSYASLNEAESLLTQALLRDPEFHDAKLVLGSVYYSQQETGLKKPDQAFANAAKLYEQVLTARPNDASAKGLLLSVNAMRDEIAGAYMASVDAIPPLQELVNSAPNALDIRIELIRLLNTAGRPDDALEQIQKALQFDPVSDGLYYLEGRLYQRLDQYAEARKSYERTLELQPNQPNAHGRLADLDLATGDGVGFVSHMLDAMQVDPRDHEIATSIAWFLYRLELLEFGDVYRDRSVLISPDSPSARLAQLVSARARHDKKLSDELARKMIIDNVDERHGSYFMAVLTVLLNSVENESAAEALAFIEQHQPGFNDPNSNEISFKVRFAQTGAFSAWYSAYGSEKAASMADDLWNVMESSGLRAVDNAETYMEVLALRGETEAAVDFALENVMKKTITEAIWWREIFDQSYMQDVSADVRIKTGLKQWDEEAMQLRDDVRQFLVSRE